MPAPLRLNKKELVELIEATEEGGGDAGELKTLLAQVDGDTPPKPRPAREFSINDEPTTEERVDTHGQSPWHYGVQASPAALRAERHSPTGRARGTLPYGLLELIRSEYTVPEETRQARRRRKPNEGRLNGRRTHEATKAPQSVPLIPPQKIVYCAEDLQSIAN